MKRKRAGYLEGIISIVVNIILFGLKYWAGIVSGSVALLADAWHTLTDSVSSIIVILGMRLSGKKADRKHPFGHGRWEQVSSILIAALLAMIAFNFLMESIELYKEHKAANFGTVAIVVTIASILAKEGMAQYAFYLEKKSGNKAVKADGWHHRSDALSSLLVLAGIFLGNYFWWIDSLLGVLISLLLLYAVYQILKESVDSILGHRPSPELIEEIKTLIEDYEQRDLLPHHFLLHEYGNHRELTFHIKVRGDCSIDYAHEIATRVEKLIKQEMDISATIHLEPYEAQ
ncbi:MAG: cation diffusion facilitator family transporter [Bacteroidales bacterium]|nr:cation diffusion facilitator family transporter [Bacteroidales bacterium]MCF8327646.1 cation diffusion facilitator family transporter [Bacteroidales bacterium]